MIRTILRSYCTRIWRLTVQTFRRIRSRNVLVSFCEIVDSDSAFRKILTFQLPTQSLLRQASLETRRRNFWFVGSSHSAALRFPSLRVGNESDRREADQHIKMHRWIYRFSSFKVGDHQISCRVACFIPVMRVHSELLSRTWQMRGEQVYLGDKVCQIDVKVSHPEGSPTFARWIFVFYYVYGWTVIYVWIILRYYKTLPYIGISNFSYIKYIALDLCMV